MSELRNNIPKGKTRVIGVDLFDHSEYLVKDCDTTDEAFALADARNKKRTGTMDDVYYAYSDTGEFLRGCDDVKGETKGLGVSP